MTPTLVYFSGVSENTHRFALKLSGVDVMRLPLKASEAALMELDRPYALLVPTYGGGKEGNQRYVPIQVVKFLNQAVNREHLQLVLGSGNINFGAEYGLAADVIATKCGVPVAFKFELLGTPEDVTKVEEGLKEFWISNFHTTT